MKIGVPVSVRVRFWVFSTRLFYNKTFSARHFMVTHLFSNFVLTLHQRVLHTHVVEKSYWVDRFIFKIEEVTTLSVRSIYKGENA